MRRRASAPVRTRAVRALRGGRPRCAQWYNGWVQDSPWRQTLARTRRTAFGRLASLLGATELTPEFWESLEAALIQADVGVHTTLQITEALQKVSKTEGYTRGDQVQGALRHALVDRLQMEKGLNHVEAPRIAILVGVNGSGKTTMAARLAYHWKRAGRKILFAAADTYRAAAKEQLQIWGELMDVDVIGGQPGSDPGAVVYSAVEAAVARKVDDLIVDTSGRMHTHHNLMGELQKICRVAGKVVDGGPHLVLLILDATTGQNGLSQAKAFTAAVDVDGVGLAKLDSSAKGGVAFAVSEELGLPILFVGHGENVGDLSTFDAERFVDALMASEDPIQATT
jgi:fused signal recognition particle receptor